MKYAMPDTRVPSGCTRPVSSAPQSFPFAYTTWCIPESPLGTRWMEFLNGGVEQAGSARHSRSGTFPGFWATEPGTAYGSTRAVRDPRTGAGVAESSELVFVIDHTRRRSS